MNIHENLFSIVYEEMWLVLYPVLFITETAGLSTARLAVVKLYRVRARYSGLIFYWAHVVDIYTVQGIEWNSLTNLQNLDTPLPLM